MDKVTAHYRKRLVRRYVQSRFRRRSAPWRRKLARGLRTGPFRTPLRRRLVFERHILVSASGRAFDDTTAKFGAASTVAAFALTGGRPLADAGNLVLTARIGALGLIPALLVSEGRRVALSSTHAEHRPRATLPRIGPGRRGFLAYLAFPSWQALLSARRGLASGWDFVLPVDSEGVPGTSTFRADYPRLPGDTGRLLTVFRDSAASVSFMCAETSNAWRPEFRIICHEYSGDQLRFLQDIERTLLQLPHQWHVWTALEPAGQRLHDGRKHSRPQIPEELGGSFPRIQI